MSGSSSGCRKALKLLQLAAPSVEKNVKSSFKPVSFNYDLLKALQIIVPISFIVNWVREICVGFPRQMKSLLRSLSLNRNMFLLYVVVQTSILDSRRWVEYRPSISQEINYCWMSVVFWWVFLVFVYFFFFFKLLYCFSINALRLFGLQLTEFLTTNNPLKAWKCKTVCGGLA